MSTQVLQGRYELNRLIGSGGMAQVWEAHDAVLERLVAVKTVDIAGTDDPTLGERLQREAKATATLAHPDIVTVYDAGMEGTTAFFVMELLAGRDLAAVIAQGGQLPVDEVVRIGQRVCGALAVAHEAGIVHRDIKPANVLVHGSNVTVVDFGIAAVAREAGSALTKPGTVLGTAQYMAPEQADGRVASSSSDMYAFGCVLTAMLTGNPPFSGANPVAVLLQQVSASPPPLRDARPDVPPPLEHLVGALLTKDPAGRPTARDAQQALAGMAPDLAAAVAPPVVAAAATKVLPAGGAPLVPPGGGASQPQPDATQVLSAHELPSPAARPAPSPRRRSPRWLLVVGATAALLVAVLAIAFGTNRQGPEAAPEDPAAVEEQPAVEPAPAAEEPAAPPTAEDVTERINAVTADDATRGDLLARWEEVTDALSKGDAEKVGEQSAELSATLDDLVDEGELSAADADALRAVVVAVVGEIPPGEEADGEGNGNGRGGKDD